MGGSYKPQILLQKSCQTWCFNFSFQTVPCEKPSLVQPTLDKVEVDALKRDLKRFEENYPARVSRAWAQWVQDADKLLELPVNWDWPMEILEKCSKIRPTTEDVTVPGHLQALRDKETVETQQVLFGHF